MSTSKRTPLSVEEQQERRAAQRRAKRRAKRQERAVERVQLLTAQAEQLKADLAEMQANIPPPSAEDEEPMALLDAKVATLVDEALEVVIRAQKQPLTAEEIAAQRRLWREYYSGRVLLYGSLLGWVTPRDGSLAGWVTPRGVFLREMARKQAALEAAEMERDMEQRFIERDQDADTPEGDTHGLQRACTADH